MLTACSPGVGDACRGVSATLGRGGIASPEPLAHRRPRARRRLLPAQAPPHDLIHASLAAADTGRSSRPARFAAGVRRAGCPPHPLCPDDPIGRAVRRLGSAALLRPQRVPDHRHPAPGRPRGSAAPAAPVLRAPVPPDLPRLLPGAVRGRRARRARHPRWLRLVGELPVQLLVSSSTPGTTRTTCSTSGRWRSRSSSTSSPRPSCCSRRAATCRRSFSAPSRRGLPIASARSAPGGAGTRTPVRRRPASTRWDWARSSRSPGHGA
jgi:hypothetical protein